MAVLSAELVRRLARWRGDGSPVVSVLLNVDGRQQVRPQDYERQLDLMVRDLLGREAPSPGVADELTRIQRFVNERFQRGQARGLAVFACADQDLWEVVESPLPLENHIAVNLTPHVRQLEVLLDENESVGVLLTDRQTARVLYVELGQVVERAEMRDPLPRHDDDRGDWDRDHVRDHAAAVAQHHLRNACQMVFDLYKRRHFDHLAVGAPEELLGEVQRYVHPYLVPKIAGRVSLPVHATDDEITACITQLTQMVERRKEAGIVDRLRALVGANQMAGRTNGNSKGAVAGLPATLMAVYEHRVDTLVVSEGYVAPGWRCQRCTYIGTRGRACPMCGAEMTQVDDVVEEAVEDALGQACAVEFCVGNADLDVIGRIGALLRF